MEAAKEFNQQDYWNAIYDVESKMSVTGIFERIGTLADIFSDFVKYGDEFYEKCDATELKSDEDQETDELLDMLISSSVKKLFFTIPAFILFVRQQEVDYIDYIKESQIAPMRNSLSTLIAIHKKTLHTIYDFESNDLINDLYLTLKYVVFVFENFDELIKPESDPVEILRNNEAYSHISMARNLNGLRLVPIADLQKEIAALRHHFEDMIIALRTNSMQSGKIKWLGTSTELAYMFEQLAYRGYIENPQTKDGDMNKTALAREVWGHIAPENVKEETFVVDLRGSRLGENSSFAKAMNSIPSNPKIK